MNKSVNAPQQKDTVKRINFTVRSAQRVVLQEPGFLENCSDLPGAMMKLMEDCLETSDGSLRLPLTIEVQPAAGQPTC
jgi:hypothetical protein